MIGVIVEFDRPYSGGIEVTPAAWTLVIENNRLESYLCARQRAGTDFAVRCP